MIGRFSMRDNQNGLGRSCVGRIVITLGNGVTLDDNGAIRLARLIDKELAIRFVSWMESDAQ